MTPEQIDAEIWRLVEQATEPAQRATLMALYKINQSQSLMLKQLGEHTATLAAHSSLHDRAKGGWRVLLAIGGILWGLAISVGGYYVNQFTDVRDRVIRLEAHEK